MIAQITSNPCKISSRRTKEFADTLAKSEKPGAAVSYAMMEGCIAASVIVEAARRMGARPNREGFVLALDSVGMLDLGGYSIGFKPTCDSVPSSSR